MELVRNESISDQEALVDLLKKDGYEVTQSSVSRDIKALGLRKTGGRYISSWEAGPSWTDVFPLVLDLQAAGPNLLVLKTPPGGAQRVAFALDHLAIPGIVGTVAGDDNVFIACRDKKAQERIRERMSSP